MIIHQVFTSACRGACAIDINYQYEPDLVEAHALLPVLYQRVVSRREVVAPNGGLGGPQQGWRVQPRKFDNFVLRKKLRTVVLVTLPYVAVCVPLF